MLKHLLIIIYSSLIASSYAEQKLSVNYCVDPNWAPYESIVKQKHTGISKIFVDLIAEKSNINFILVPTSSWEESLEFVKSGQCDLIPLINTSEKRRQYLSFSDDYFRAPNAIYAHFKNPIIGNLSGLTNQSIAVVKSYRLHHHLSKHFPNTNLVPVENGFLGLQKVENNEVDYFVGSFHAANRIIQENNFSNIRIAGIANLEDQLRIGVAKEKEYLLPIFNQAIAQITKEERKKVTHYLKSIKIIEPPNYRIALQVSCLFLIIVVILLIRYLQLKQHGRALADKNMKLEELHHTLAEKNLQLTELAMKDPLTGLFNRTHLSKIIEQQIKLTARYQTQVCMLMIDIDDFKAINDNHGHTIGDNILKNIAKTLLSIARETDIVSRWGGEEFVVVCPETSLEEAYKLAERIQKGMTKIHIDEISGVTCSIGIAELEKGITASEWFKYADKAMYQAKFKGKDCIQIMS
ncbi:diguanylate cyclase [Thalassotalea profundi]|uniref:diguanylate cyclase n=1 Tax=Thalassotalea profundi TaxID=2036687 RepID=A0ABQ3IIJ2_9GAMM|nr:diguanylate cyclase [Thalassotalea profundi]GHE81757.1 diguanylate cyclase [Thalassotalea profundi]